VTASLEEGRKTLLAEAVQLADVYLGGDIRIIEIVEVPAMHARLCAR
jgi:hypothetical protein